MAKEKEAICEAECPVCGGIVKFTELGFTVCPYCEGTRAELTITDWEIIKDKEKYDKNVRENQEKIDKYLLI